MTRHSFRKFLLTLIFFWLVCCYSLTGYGQSVEDKVSSAKEMVQQFMKKEQVPGFAISVYKDGKIIWSEGFGYASLELKVPVDASKTKFRIGSVSKSFTAIALAQMYEAGKLNLDVPIQQYVPSFPKKVEDITLRQLGGHTAGIRHYRGTEFLSSKRYESVTEGLAMFQDDSLLFTPGTDYSYSSYGWNLISAAIETASGENFLDYMQEHVFEAMEMDHTVADYPELIIEDRTNFYVLENDTIFNAPYVDNSYKWAGGGFLSTTEDLITFGKKLMKPGFLKQETLDLLFTSQKTTSGEKTEYGIGFFDRTDGEGRRWIGHSGGSVGGTTMFFFNKEADIIVAMVANRTGVKYDDFHYQIGAHFIE